MAIYDTTNMNVVSYRLQLIHAIYGSTKYELCTLQVAKTIVSIRKYMVLQNMKNMNEKLNNIKEVIQALKLAVRYPVYYTCKVHLWYSVGCNIVYYCINYKCFKNIQIHIA